MIELCGQFVIEATTAPEHVDEFFVRGVRLLHAQAGRIDAVELQRARNQLAVRALRAGEQPARRLEAAALDLFALGRVRSRAELAAAIEAVPAAQVRETFARLLRAPVRGHHGQAARRPQRACARTLSARRAHDDAARGSADDVAPARFRPRARRTC